MSTRPTLADDLGISSPSFLFIFELFITLAIFGLETEFMNGNKLRSKGQRGAREKDHVYSPIEFSFSYAEIDFIFEKFDLFSIDSFDKNDDDLLEIVFILLHLL